MNAKPGFVFSPLMNIIAKRGAKLGAEVSDSPYWLLRFPVQALRFRLGGQLLFDPMSLFYKQNAAARFFVDQTNGKVYEVVGGSAGALRAAHRL